MFWRRSAALIVALVLAALPVAGGVCAALCADPVSVPSTVDKTPAPGCHESTSSATEIRGTFEHDCGRHDSAAVQPTVNVGRIAAPPPLVGVVSAAAVHSTAHSVRCALFRTCPPPGALPFSDTPRILRI